MLYGNCIDVMKVLLIVVIEISKVLLKISIDGVCTNALALVVISIRDATFYSSYIIERS